MMNSVIWGDCLEEMKKIETGSIDMILCDLPYQQTQNKWDIIIPFEPLWEQYERIIKDEGAIILTASQPFTSLLATSNLKLFRYSIVWEKERPSNPFVSKTRFMRWHEDILIFYKKQPVFHPQMEDRPKGNGRKNKLGENKSESYQGTHIKKAVSDTDKKFPSSVLKFYVVNGKEKVKHSTQKPVKLFEYMIKTYSNPGDVILDNAAGSGTTAIAAMNTGRNYILIEKEKEYVDIINKRIQDHERVGALL